MHGVGVRRRAVRAEDRAHIVLAQGCTGVDQLGANGSCDLDDAVSRCRIIRNESIELERFNARQWLDAVEPRPGNHVPRIERWPHWRLLQQEYLFAQCLQFLQGARERAVSFFFRKPPVSE